MIGRRIGAAGVLLTTPLGLTSGCSDAVVTAHQAKPDLTQATAHMPTATPRSATDIPPVSAAHLRDLAARGYAITPVAPDDESVEVTLAQAVLAARKPGFVGRNRDATVEASFVRVTMQHPRDAQTQRLLVVDRPVWLVVFGGKAISVPIFGPAPASSAVWVGQTTGQTPPTPSTANRKTSNLGTDAISNPPAFKADWASFVDASTGRMIKATAI